MDVSANPARDKPERAADDTGASAKHHATEDAKPMTTGNDPAQPAPTDQPAPTTPAATDAPAQADMIAAAAERMMGDPDLIELAAAKEAVKVEETAKSAGGEPETVQGAAPTDTKPAAAPARATSPQGEQPMIPKPRLDEALGRATKAEQAAAYWQGVAEARKAGTSQEAQPQPQQRQAAPQDQLAAIRSSIDDLANRFDAGEITMADMKKQERTLADQEAAIREEMLVAKVGPAKSGNELYLDTLTAALEAQHPWVMFFDQAGSDADWAYLKASAMESLAARGIDPTKGDIGRYELRKEMAQLADELGPALLSRKAQEKGVVLPGQQSQGQQQPRGPSAQATARAAKLAASAGAPPNLSAMRGTGDDPAAPTASRMETMTDEEIAALPASVKNKFLGITA